MPKKPGHPPQVDGPESCGPLASSQQEGAASPPKLSVLQDRPERCNFPAAGTQPSGAQRTARSCASSPRTKSTIASTRDARTGNSANLAPMDPVTLGLAVADRPRSRSPSAPTRKSLHRSIPAQHRCPPPKPRRARRPQVGAAAEPEKKGGELGRLAPSSPNSSSSAAKATKKASDRRVIFPWSFSVFLRKLDAIFTRKRASLHFATSPAGR